MNIDKKPIIDSINKTFTVKNNIDTSDDVSISVNGLVTIFLADIESINNNVIKIRDDSYLEWDYDSFVIFYTELI